MLSDHTVLRPLRRVFPLSALSSVGLLLLATTACSVRSTSPSTALLPTEVPPAYARPNTEAPATLTTANWLESIGGPRLNQLFEESRKANFDLRIAFTRLEQADANRRIAISDNRPELNASAGADRGRSNSGSHSNSFSGTLRVSWEVDLWGRVRQLVQAGLADYESELADYDGAFLSLQGQVARAWFNAVADLAQVRLAQRTLETFKSNLEVTEEKFRRGIEPALDVYLLRSSLAAARAEREASERDFRASTRSLEVLLGRYPEASLIIDADIPTELPAIPAGLPSDLLYRRPDLRAAERSLAAAEARFSAARKNRLPAITLTGSGGVRSDELEEITDLDFRFWNLATGLSAPLYRAGELKAVADRNGALYEQSLANFGKTAIEAFEEVENALDAQSSIAREAQSLLERLDASRAAEEIAWERYNRGLVDIITVLEAQRRATNAELAYINVLNRRIQRRIDLHLALGGDFSTQPSNEFDQL